MGLPHETRPIKVWVDVDIGIAKMVEYLNTIPGVRTQASCQGTIGEGGPHPYRAYVLCDWSPEALVRLKEEFDVVPYPSKQDIKANPLASGDGSWGYVHPRKPKREV